MESPLTPRADRRTILFVDVVASTELYADLGDADARARIGPCLDELRALVERRSGTTVKSLGDGILAAFGGAAPAVEAALDMLALAPRHRLRVHVGVHTGEVLVEGGDIFGQAVNTASRLSELARPSEILVSRDVIAALPAIIGLSKRRLQNVIVRGLREPLELFALSREDPSATQANVDSVELADVLPSFGLEIALGGRTWAVNPLSGLRLGRDPGSDVVVEGDRVSRRHAVIVARRGLYVLADQSVNGTWVVSDDGTHAQLLREEATLHGSGRIYLGVPPGNADARAISYRTLA